MARAEDARGGASSHPGEIHEAVDAFTHEVALLYFRMTIAATQFLGQGRHSSGRRSLIKSLGADGPQTVPAMARARAVSRQHVQKLVDELRRDGMVTSRPNPAHKRSKLVDLTPAGRRFLHEMSKREVALFEELAEGIPAQEFRRAAELVRSLRTRLEQHDWDQGP